MNLQRTHSFVMAALFAALLLQPGCLALKARNAGPDVKYYASVADYVGVKIAAAAYAESPASDADAIEAILDVVNEADRVIAEIEVVRAAGAITDLKYEQAVSVLNAIARRLERLTTPALSNGGGAR